MGVCDRVCRGLPLGSAHTLFSLLTSLETEPAVRALHTPGKSNTEPDWSARRSRGSRSRVMWRSIPFVFFRYDFHIYSFFYLKAVLCVFERSIHKISSFTITSAALRGFPLGETKRRRIHVERPFLYNIVSTELHFIHQTVCALCAHCPWTL